MPGDLVVFADAPEATRLIHALAGLRENAEFDFALVGGLAVAGRLRSYHRATQDLDALTSLDRHEFEDLAIEAIGGARMLEGHLLVDGVRVDVIDIDPTVPYPQIADLPDPADRLFTAAHLFAHADATPLTMRSGTDETTVLVASARSLLITKLHGYVNPRRDTRKHGSDALDIYELGRQLVAPTATVRPYGSPQIPPARARGRAVGRRPHPAPADRDDPPPRDHRGHGKRRRDQRARRPAPRRPGCCERGLTRSNDAAPPTAPRAADPTE